MVHSHSIRKFQNSWQTMTEITASSFFIIAEAARTVQKEINFCFIRNDYFSKQTFSTSLISLSDDPLDGQSIIWDNIESAYITPARGDVLAIMDIPVKEHSAKNLNLNDLHLYERLAPTVQDSNKGSSSDKSFTWALIQSLEGLLTQNSPFTTSDLAHTMKAQLGGNTAPVLDSQAQAKGRPIVLRSLPARDEVTASDEQPAAYLDLRLELKDNKLPAEALQELAWRIGRAVKESSVKTRRIDLQKLSPRKRRSWRTVLLAVMFIVRLRRPVNKLQKLEEWKIHRPDLLTTFGTLDRPRNSVRHWLMQIGSLGIRRRVRRILDVTLDSGFSGGLLLGGISMFVYFQGRSIFRWSPIQFLREIPARISQA
jgi:hypothetical protein